MDSTQQEWLARGRELATAHDNQLWAIANWLVEGMPLYPACRGEASRFYDDAQSVFKHLTRDSIRKYAQTARYFAGNQLPAGLTFSHLLATMVVGESDRARWLQQAADGGWSVPELRFQIAQATPTEDPFNRAVDVNLDAAPTPDVPDAPVKARPVKAPDTSYKAVRDFFKPLSLRMDRIEKLTAVCRAIKTQPSMLLRWAVDEYLERHKDLVDGALDIKQKDERGCQPPPMAPGGLPPANRRPAACEAVPQDQPTEAIGGSHVENDPETPAGEYVAEQTVAAKSQVQYNDLPVCSA